MIWANRSLAHFFWATWANPSWSLICLEQPERFAHGRSFPLSNLNDSLMVAHLPWALWANRSQSLIWFEQNERMSNEQMSEFPALSWIHLSWIPEVKEYNVYSLITAESIALCTWMVELDPSVMDPRGHGVQCVQPNNCGKYCTLHLNGWVGSICHGS